MTMSTRDVTSNGRRRYMSVQERSAQGKAARSKAPRSGQAHWSLSERNYDPLDLLGEQALTRAAELVPIRHGRMAASPFAYFRGAAYPMAADLASAARTDLEVQLCGDAHLCNFGGFASPERDFVFDLNDFDETHPGPFEWDVKRLAASIDVAARSRNFDSKLRSGLVAKSVRSYREAMRHFAGERNLDIWYERLNVAGIMARWGGDASRNVVASFQRQVAKAQTKDRLKALAKLTYEVDGELQIKSDPPLVVPVEELFNELDAKKIEDLIHQVIRAYRRSLTGDRRHLLESYRFVHLARKVVGVGSVGTHAWVVLMLGRDNDDPLFIQVKEAEASVLERFLGRSTFENHGHRVVEGQRLMQAATDIFLGWERSVAPDGVDAGFLVSPAMGLEGVGRHRNDAAPGIRHLRPDVRVDAGEGSCEIRRCDRNQLVSRWKRYLRPSHGRVRQ